jgi:hypothetical protein
VTLAIDTPIGALLDHPNAKALLDQHLPGLSTHPQIAMARDMTLAAVIPYSGGIVTEEKLQVVKAALAQLA